MFIATRQICFCAILALSTADAIAQTFSICGQSYGLPSDDEVDAGIDAMVEAVGVYEDQEVGGYVSRVGQQLLAKAGLDIEAYTFTVLDSPAINASAARGGRIFIYRGLLALLNSEAELAGVLGHEIGHLTEQHYSRRKMSEFLSQMASATTCILTGNRDIADATSIYSAELKAGFGRDRELEADAAAASYLHSAGYEVDSMLTVLGVLKDHEQYERAKAKASGKPSGTYHGLYASHPRNDLRLQTVIRSANELDIDEMPENPEIPGEFRRQTDGLVYGASATAQGEPNRFYHNKLNFTFAHPPGWTVSQSSRAIVATSADGSQTLTIGLARIDPDKDTEAGLLANAQGDVTDLEVLEQYGLKGSTAVASSGGQSVRLAVIDHSYRFLFEGEAPDLGAADADFRTIIDSFRPLTGREKVTGTSHTLHYIQVPRGATFASLASSVKLPDAENQLRLINGYYPTGEPRTGDWVKVIR